MTLLAAVAPAPAGAAAVRHFVVLDACVLMSSILRPLLLQAAALGWYEPVWSVRIGDEWRRNAARVWGVAPDVVAAEWLAMTARFPDADAGDVAPYEAVLRYGDAKDRHVVAAGLARRARAMDAAPPACSVLTWNLKDFDKAELRRQGMTLLDPDRLFASWVLARPEPSRAWLAQAPAHAAALGKGGTMDEVLRRERLFRTAALLARTACA